MGTYIIPTEIMIDAKDAVYRSTEFAISGAINKVSRGIWHTFQETLPNHLAIGEANYYFKSLDKVVIKPVYSQLVFPQAPTATNLITNGTFDTDTSGWTASWATITRDTTIFSNGGIKVTSTSAFRASAVQTVSNLVIGKKYKVEVQGYAPATNTNAYASIGLDIAGILMEHRTQKVYGSIVYITFEFYATSSTQSIHLCVLDPLVEWGGVGEYAIFDNIAVFAATDLLRYDNLLLRDDGTYVITQTEQNQYITMDTMLNYTSTVYNVADGSSTGTSVTFTHDMVNEEYSGSDGHKYLTIGATARFNQGAYHPVFNPYGTSHSNNTVNVNGSAWYKSTYALPPRNIAESFLKRTSRAEYGACELLSGGALVTNESGRPDGKFYDIIYNELWIDQRWRAEYVDGTKERTTIERDKDISASQYADFVGSATLETKKIGCGVGGVADNFHFGGYTAVNDYLKFVNLIGRYLQVYLPNGTVAKDILVSNAVDDPTYGVMVYSASNGTYDREGSYTYASIASNLRYGSTTFLHTDIVGNPANYPQVWKDALAGGGSIAGTPLLVGENGENYTAGTINPKYSKKAIAGNNTIYYNGSIWQYVSTLIDQIANTFGAAVIDTSFINMMNYQAYNNNLAPIVNSKVVGGSAGVSDVYANSLFIANIANLTNNLVNKVATDNAAGCIAHKNINGVLAEQTGIINAYTNQENVYHDTIVLYASTSPAVKLFSYLTNSTNGTRHKQCYVFKEMKYDATGVNQDGTPTDTWGDDNKFNIVSDGVNTTIDNNGNAILVGNKARLVDYRVKE
jgi:hypothetical protein